MRGKPAWRERISEDFNGKLILEEFADNPFLPKFYKDPIRHAFPLELYFMAERYQQLRELSAEGDLFADFTVSDYIFYKSLIFASNNLSPDETRLYQRLFSIINPTLPQPELILYLYKSVDQLLANIQKRGRSFEQDIQPEYLASIHRTYISYFKTQEKARIVIIDTDDMNFIDNSDDYNKIIEVIQQDFPQGLTYIDEL